MTTLLPLRQISVSQTGRIRKTFSAAVNERMVSHQLKAHRETATDLLQRKIPRNTKSKNNAK